MYQSESKMKVYSTKLYEDYAAAYHSRMDTPPDQTVSANMVDSAVDECNHSLNGVFGQKDLFVYSCKCHMVGRAFRYYYMCL